MSLSRSVTPDEATIELLFNPLATPQLQHLRLGQARQGGEVEGVEVLLDRELGVLDPRGDRVGGAGGQLELGQAEQELDEGLVARGGVPRQLLELLAHRRQAELPEVGLEQLDHDIGHRHGPFQKGLERRRTGPDGRARQIPIRRRTR